MADRRTKSVLARGRIRKRLLAAFLGAAVGLALRFLFRTQLVGTFFDEIQMAGELAPALRTWLDVHSNVTGWLATPLVLGLGAFAAAPAPGFRYVLDLLIPDPPGFARSSLEDARKAEIMLELETETAPFVGRVTELRALEGFLEPSHGPFAWWTVSGPSGVGKTRLALEWLERAQSRNWDVGVVDRADRHLIAGWRPRRPTALLIDEVRRDWGDTLGQVLAEFQRSASASRLIRLLVVDQVAAAPDLPTALERAAVERAKGTFMRLSPFGAVELDELGAAVGGARIGREELLRESAGLPRAALVLLHAPNAASYRAAVSDWAGRLVPQLNDPIADMPMHIVGPLFFAALAGPVPMNAARELFGPIQTRPLERYFQNATAEQLEEHLPPIRPAALADELVLQLAPRLDKALRERAVIHAIEQAPGSVEARLLSLWQSRCQFSSPDLWRQAPAALFDLQAEFDARCPDRVTKLRQAAIEAAEALQTAGLAPAEVERLVASIDEVVAGRPFDPVVRNFEARGLAQAASHYGEAGDVERMESCGVRIVQLAAESSLIGTFGVGLHCVAAAANVGLAYAKLFDFPRFEAWTTRMREFILYHDLAEDEDARMALAHAAFNAIRYYGEAGRLDEMERWGELLLGEGDRPPDVSPPRRVLQASAIVASFYILGSARRFDDLERWGRRLDRFLVDERDESDPAIRVEEMNAAVNASGVYGSAGKFDDMERWVARAFDVGEDPRFEALPEIRLVSARTAVNAVAFYGQAAVFHDMERWLRRLCAIADDRRFQGCLDIRLHEARGLGNAILSLARHDDYDALKPWEARLLALVEDEEYCRDARFRGLELQCAVGLSGSYARTQSFRELERWGERVRAVVADENLLQDLGLSKAIASTAANALSAYTQAGRFDWPPAQQWLAILASLAARFVDQMAIQEIANEYGVTKVSQMAMKRR